MLRLCVAGQYWKPLPRSFDGGKNRNAAALLKRANSSNGPILSGRRYDTKLIIEISVLSTYLTLFPELVHIHSALHQGQFQKVLEFDTSDFSESNELPARVLKLRAQLALGQYDDVILEVKSEADSVPDLAAAKALAQYCKDPRNADEAVQAASKLSKEQADSLGVQLLAGTVLANAGLTEEALALLAKHQGSLDA